MAEVIHRDCVVCLAEVEPGFGAADATLTLLKTLETVPLEQAVADLCFAHRRRLALEVIEAKVMTEPFGPVRVELGHGANFVHFVPRIPVRQLRFLLCPVVECDGLTITSIKVDGEEQLAIATCPADLFYTPELQRHLVLPAVRPPQRVEVEFSGKPGARCDVWVGELEQIEKKFEALAGLNSGREG